MHLHSSGEFPDWTVTTAFYCAMHYVYSVIFPCVEHGDNYLNFEAYFEKFKRPNETKHGFTLILLKKKHFSVAEKYKQRY